MTTKLMALAAGEEIAAKVTADKADDARENFIMKCVDVSTREEDDVDDARRRCIN